MEQPHRYLLPEDMKDEYKALLKERIGKFK